MVPDGDVCSGGVVYVVAHTAARVVNDPLLAFVTASELHSLVPAFAALVGVRCVVPGSGNVAAYMAACEVYGTLLAFSAASEEYTWVRAFAALVGVCCLVVECGPVTVWKEPNHYCPRKV
jgi:hypothetical protein